MASCFSGKVFFYCAPAGVPESSNYQHGLVCLAEGFEEIGVRFFSNLNYWPKSLEKDDYLFKHEPSITPDDCEIVIIGSVYLEHYKQFPENLFHSTRRYITVYIDLADGIITNSWKPEFRQFDFILKAHYNSKCTYPSNMYPWAFGLSNRILKESNPLPFKDRDWQVVVNFRVQHLLRDHVRAKFLSHLQDHLPLNAVAESFNPQSLDPSHYLLWSLTGRRHYPSYYERLCRSVACAGFGGEFIPAFPRDMASPAGLITQKIMKRKLLRFLHPKYWRILQWDSWRFWESLAAGCVTFHLDFDQYGFCLPDMPENWRHYIGVDLTNVQESINRICDEPELLEKISIEGRQWALAHYSPKPIALRLIDLIEKSSPLELTKAS